jgi:4-diphosphocytidyl-2-C-methyl-D-erythritol kinase
VLAVADGGLSTVDVYAECDRLRAAQRTAQVPGAAEPIGASRDLLAALRSGDAAAVGALLSNDLQAAAISLRPPLRRTLEAGSEHGALGSIVSGSGPTCAFLARSERHAVDLAAALAGAGVCRKVARASGPVAGAMASTHTTGRSGAT